MSALKKPKLHSIKAEHTSTRTALAEPGESKIEDLLQQSTKHDPALVVIQGDQLGLVFHLKRGTTLLGRNPDCDIVIKQRAVSSAHAEFRTSESGEITLEDKGSTNGTILNNQKIDRPVVLRGGDLIKIGTQVLKYFDKQADTQFLEKLGAQGRVDSLTGVWNKGHLLQALSSSIDVAKKGYPLSIILFDIDHFKKINDTHGHLAGDYVLKELTRVLKDTIMRNEDVFGRFGGEEFMLILPDSALKVGLSIAERMRQGLEKHMFMYDSKSIPVTSSFGVAEWDDSCLLPENILENADRALYQAKNQGRNCVRS